MSQGMREISNQQINAALETVLLPKLAVLLTNRKAGHCMRVGDLDSDLMILLAGGLRAAAPHATVVILADDNIMQLAPQFAISSTKLVELRNPLPNDVLRPPLLVFVPNNLRASAEDSFGVATFEEISIEGAYQELIEQLIGQIPADLRSVINSLINQIRDVESGWRFADDAAIVRYLLTAKINEFDPEVFGAALYELALIPDFALLTQPDQAPGKISRNLGCVRTITGSTRTDRARALELELKDAVFSKKLGDFFAQVGASNPKEWTRIIVRDRASWPLAFNKWDFADGGVSPEAIFIGEVRLPDLPIIKEDEADPRLLEFIGLPVLPISATGLKKFSVAFQVNPAPAKVEKLSRFVAEVISRDNGPTGLRRRKAAWSRPTDTGTISFSSLNKVEWEEGWHFVRIYAETEDGERIPLRDAEDNIIQFRNIASEETAPPNESELFYVVTDEEVEVEPPQRAIPRDASLLHAFFRAQFTAVSQGRNPGAISITDCGWVERSGKSRVTGSETLEVRLGKEGKANIIVSSLLAELERCFLGEPKTINRLRLEISAMGRNHRTNASFQWPDSEPAQRFLVARIKYFSVILQGEKKLITQASDLLLRKEEAVNYASAYCDWLDSVLRNSESSDAGVARQAIAELRYLLTIDSIALVLEDYRGNRREAVLLAPTHPLRVVWHSAWAQLGAHWLELAERTDKEFVAPTRDAVLKQLTPTGFPAVLPFSEEFGRSAIAVDNLNPFWSLYAAADEKDPRGLVGEVCSVLGLPEPAIGGAAIDSNYMAARIQRYLLQHPYVRTLIINAFNVGRATILAEVLLALQRNQDFKDLRYDIRLFVIDPDSPITGEALVGLLMPDSGTTAKEADAFATPTESHLYPKLRLAIRSIKEFRNEPEAHSSHLAILFDIFPAEEIRAIDVRTSNDSSFVHGLIQPFAVQYQEDEQSITWLRHPLHGASKELAGSEELSDLLGTMSRAVSVASATVARSQYLPNVRPAIALSLSADERALLHQIHEVSDWVMTIDRNLGIEFFDHRRHPTRPDYLIDHSPDIANAMSHRMAITSRSIAELESLLIPILTEYELPNTSKHAIVILDQLRSLSGRLALKLLSSSAQKAEALGLALSRLFLEHQGVFQNQIVVPLDAHLELYNALRQNAQELGDEVSFRRTDLALFDLNLSKKLITCRLVEVKCYSMIGEIAAYEALKNTISEQISQTEQVIAYHFDIYRTNEDRPDRAIKNRDLSALLEFYLDRSQRYDVVLPDVAAEARIFLRHLDAYTLKFTRSGIVFDFSKSGTEAPQHENGIEYYRIGRDLISQLIESAVVDTESLASLQTDKDVSSINGMAQELRQRRNLAPAVPTYETAAFLSPARDRTLTSEETVQSGYEESENKPTWRKRVSGPEPQNQQVESSYPAMDSVRSIPLSALDNVEDNSIKSDSSNGEEKLKLEEYQSQITATADLELTETCKLVEYDIMLGVTGISPQYGLLGEVSGRKIALDLNQTHTISLFGVQGGGKSYTLGAVAEMASLSIPGINKLPEPLATVIFHYSPTMDYKPEFTSMVAQNTIEEQIAALRNTYGAEPKALKDVILLVPFDKLEERIAEYSDIQVLPLQFSSSELKASHWKFLMGAVGNQATYIRQIMRIMKTMRDNITLDGLRQGINASTIPDHLKDMARMRLDLASEYINDEVSLTDVVRPGRLIIVDLRDEFIEKDEALGLFVVLLQLFADARIDGRIFNKLVVFDEAHKYIESPDLVAGLIEVVREMRHKGVSIMVASQDPPSVPVSLIELSSQIILHKFNSPAWLKHIQKANSSLVNITPERMAQLKAGEAFVWSSKASDESFSKGAIKIQCRPRVTLHGGATRLAVNEE